MTHWTDEERVLLLDTSLSLREVSSRTGRPYSAVKAKAHYLGVHRPVGPPRRFVALGQRFGRLVVVDPDIRVPSGKQCPRGARVRCDCGTVTEVVLSSLLRGATRSCGCLGTENRIGPKPERRKHLIRQGDVFGELVVIDPDRGRAGKDRRVGVRCACGTETEVFLGNLIRGTTKTCGCRKHITVWDRSDPAWQRRRYLWRRYHITLEQFEGMLDAQGRRCALCPAEYGTITFHVDHDHSCCPGKTSCGECVRGITCVNCNSTLGRVELIGLTAICSYLGRGMN